MLLYDFALLFLTIVEFLRQGEYFDKLEVLSFEESANFRCYFFYSQKIHTDMRHI